VVLLLIGLLAKPTSLDATVVGTTRPTLAARYTTSTDSTLLRNRPHTARAVAAVQRLATDGASPLHGYDAQALRVELRRIRFLLYG
jgi:hypothetical protein